MRPFGYSRAADVAEALRKIRRTGDRPTLPLAGGTDLLPLMKADLLAPAELVDIKRAAGLGSGIEHVDDHVEIGALATLADLEEDPFVRERFTALAEACDVAATPQLRNVATIGGNLLQRPRCWYFRNPAIDCWLSGGDDCPARPGQNQLHAIFADGPCVAVHPSDPAGALLALGAEVRLRGPAGERALPLEEFFAPPEADRRTETLLGNDELLISVRIPARTPALRSTYLKAMDRKAWAFAQVGVAVAATMGAGRVEAIRIVLTGVASVPRRATGAESIVLDGEPEPERLREAAEAAVADASPLRHNRYKVPLAGAMVRRALERTLTGGHPAADG